VEEGRYANKEKDNKATFSTGQSFKKKLRIVVAEEVLGGLRTAVWLRRNLSRLSQLESFKSTKDGAGQPGKLSPFPHCKARYRPPETEGKCDFFGDLAQGGGRDKIEEMVWPHGGGVLKRMDDCHRGG
jgi:hypothetical protein